MPSESRKQLEAWLKTIEVDGSVIDIGGSQKEVLSRTKTWNVSDYKVVDLEQPHECKRKPDIVGDIQGENKFNLLDFISAVDGFDVAFCLEVSEYWIFPSNALWNINGLLKEGGLLYISFHTLYGLHKPKGLDCLRYTKYGIEKLLKDAHFEILEMIPRKIKDSSKQILFDFYGNEGMKVDFNDPAIFDSGYLVKARKI